MPELADSKEGSLGDSSRRKRECLCSKACPGMLGHSSEMGTKGATDTGQNSKSLRASGSVHRGGHQGFLTISKSMEELTAKEGKMYNK